MIEIDWTAIRSIDSSKRTGFEELCAQIARSEYPNGFVRKGAPDAGLECFVVHEDGTIWGWQAKYFHSLGDSQWSQLDDSVKTAIQGHPQLTRCFICVPYDRPDANIAGQKSAMTKWSDHVTTWKAWASERGMSVEFEYWGSSELLDKLGKTTNAGLVRFWFDKMAFDDSWFRERFEESLKVAGPRYTPELHVELPISQDFEAFGRTDRAIDSIKSIAKEIRNEGRRILNTNDKWEESVNGEVSKLRDHFESTLTAFSSLEYDPTAENPLRQVTEEVGNIKDVCDNVLQLLAKIESDLRDAQETDERRRELERFQSYRYSVRRLGDQLEESKKKLEHALPLFSNRLVILNGYAGTGKTHLLCDLAKRRLDAHRPTVLLMGQRFLTSDDPWKQVLSLLDLSRISAEEFVGALESAAQSANCRAIFIIDAINEGNGKSIWLSHLDPFMRHLERSPWIGVILSVRTTSEPIVLTPNLTERALSITHNGFGDHEYDALKSFFSYYGLEMPSTPLLDPEFSNPLFLKTLCRGLQAKNEQRIPRGTQGITAVFNLYIESVQADIARRLGFDPRKNLVNIALESLASACAESGFSWIPLLDAQSLLDNLLPNRNYLESLYHGLLDEGLLIETSSSGKSGPGDIVINIGYERLADHLAVKSLIDSHIDSKDPYAAFAPSGSLHFLLDRSRYISTGLLQALSIQLPERFRLELADLMPDFWNRLSMADAFRQSVIWRSLGAFTDRTGKILNQFCHTRYEWNETLNTLITVSTLPGHPFNAKFLHGWLSNKSMPNRDATWSIYLHRAWNGQSVLHRIIDWAWSLKSSAGFEEQAIELCAITLTWMLTSSNRFLRDRATKALVVLLTEQIDILMRLIDRFAGVNDPYVAERLYAAAYGVAMRNVDTNKISELASVVYEKVFINGAPPAHILLRDYARGVCERALYLGCSCRIDQQKIRPPYNSIWPSIPTQEDIDNLKSEFGQTPYDSGDVGWANNRIFWSVEDDDFGRYVIGTNHGFSDWLALTHSDPSWKSVDQRLQSLTDSFSKKEARAWAKFKSFELTWSSDLTHEELSLMIEALGPNNSAPELEDYDVETTPIQERILAHFKDFEQHEEELLSALTPDHRDSLSEIYQCRNNNGGRKPDRLDLGIIQRYVIWRVFDLGYTSELFGQFDRFDVGYQGNESNKSERIGKKYQWIAYHEIMACIADHYQFREEFEQEGGVQEYEGPWQTNMRDIDPSSTLRSSPGGTLWDAHSRSWWAETVFEDWGRVDADSWIKKEVDLPDLSSLLRVQDPRDGNWWLNLECFFKWETDTPPDRNKHDVDRRELWYMPSAYIVREEDKSTFMEWAKSVTFWGRWMPNAPTVYEMYLGEYPWSPAAKYVLRPYYGFDGWTQPANECPVKVRVASFEYLKESSGFDCSVDDNYTLRLPDTELLSMLGARWNGINAQFMDSQGVVVAYDPTAEEDGPNALLVREEPLIKALKEHGLSLCWTVLGEKRILSARLGSGMERHPYLEITGAFVLTEKGVEGFCHGKLEGQGNPSAD